MELQDLTEDEIVSRYQRWAHHMAYVWGGYESTEHEDLAQEALIGVWQSLHSYEPGKGALASYIAKGGKMHLHDCLRRSKWTGSPSLRGFSIRAKPPVPFWFEGLPEEHPLKEDMALKDFSDSVNLSEHVKLALKKLTLEQRKYVYLRFWLDMAPGQIEENIDINGRHAWKLIREQLKEELSEVR